MSVALIASLFGLMAALAWGVSDFLVGKTTRAVGAMKGALLVNGCGAVIYTLVYLLFLRGGVTFTAEGIWYAVGGGLFLGLAQATFFRAMNLGPIGLVSSISSTYPLVTLLLGILFLGSDLSPLKLLGIVLVVGGVMIASGATGHRDTAKRIGKGPLVALMPVLGWGAGFVLVAQSLTRMDWEGTFLIELVLTPVVLAALAPLVRGAEHMDSRDFRTGFALPAIWGAGLLQMIGILGVNLGIARAPENAAVIVAISSCYPVLTIFLAVRHLRERIPFVPLLGGITGILGIVILSIG